MREKIKILYVDDEPTNLMLFDSMFERKFNILTAESGFLGIDLLSKNPDIRVVISDMKMPMMDGIEFITRAKSMYPDIQFYILTGFEITPRIQESLSSGLVLKYFQKPFKMAEIDKTISDNINK
jgi:two-component system, response regulator, stage 0 sporulation protein F